MFIKVSECEVQVGRTDKYPDGLKWGLICIDRVTGKKVLLDNHHPKGPHLHLDDKEGATSFPIWINW